MKLFDSVLQEYKFTVNNWQVMLILLKIISIIILIYQKVYLNNLTCNK